MKKIYWIYARNVSFDEKELLEKALKRGDLDVLSSDDTLDMLDIFKCRALIRKCKRSDHRNCMPRNNPKAAYCGYMLVEFI